MKSNSPHSGIMTLGLFLLVILVHAYTLVRVPSPFPDEPVNGERALNLLSHGVPFAPTLEQGSIEPHKRYWASYSYLAAAADAAALLLDNRVELRNLRIMSLLFGCILLGGIYQTVKLLSDRPLALWAVAAVAFSTPFTFSAHVARADIMAIAVAFAGTALYFRREPTSMLRPLLAGFLLGISIEFHPRAAALIPAPFIVDFAESRFALFRSSRFWSAMTGMLIAIGIYAAIHIFPDPDSFFSVGVNTYQASRMPSILSGRFDAVEKSFRELFVTIAFMYQFAVPLMAAAVPLVFIRRKVGEQRLLLYVFVLVLSCGLLVRNPFQINVIIVSPAFDILTALTLNSVWSGFENWRRPYRFGLRGIITGIFVAGALYNSMLLPLVLSDCPPSDYRESQEYVRKLVKPGDLILGPAVYWLAMQESNFSIWESIPAYQHRSGASVEEALMHFCPDVLIRDCQLEAFLSDAPIGHLWYDDLRISRTEFADTLKKWATLVGRYEAPCTCPVEVYRFSKMPCERHSAQ